MYDRLNRWFTLERQLYGNANWYIKRDRWSSKVRAFYARAFNYSYLEGFTTTLYPNTFFASTLSDDPATMLEIEFHENVHKWDRHKEGWMFNLAYAWPHWLGLPFVLAAIVLGVWQTWVSFGIFVTLLHLGLLGLAISAPHDPKKRGEPSTVAYVLFYVLAGIGVLLTLASSIWFGKWWAFMWLGAALFLPPWPFKPIGRRNREIRGYVMSLFTYWLQYDCTLTDLKNQVEWIAAQSFDGPSYFYMETNRDWVRNELMFHVERFTEHPQDFLQEWVWSHEVSSCDSKVNAKRAELAEPYRLAYQFLKKENLIQR